MRTAKTITLFGLREVLSSRWSLIYGLFFLLVTEGLLQFAGDTSKVLVSLMDVTLILAPLVGIVFGTMYYYNSREFIELLLTQPVRRSTVFTGVFVGLVVSLAISFIVGVTVPLLFHGMSRAAHWGMLGVLLATGTALTFVFVGIAFLISVMQPDKGKGLGIGILVWLLLAVIYDGVILFGVYALDNYPLETPVIAATVLNPIDLARIVLLMQSDISALMGYTGAVFQRFFGTGVGIGVASISLLAWVAAPFALGLNRFMRRDF